MKKSIKVLFVLMLSLLSLAVITPRVVSAAEPEGTYEAISFGHNLTKDGISIPSGVVREFVISNQSTSTYPEKGTVTFSYSTEGVAICEQDSENPSDTSYYLLTLGNEGSSTEVTVYVNNEPITKFKVTIKNYKGTITTPVPSYDLKVGENIPYGVDYITMPEINYIASLGGYVVKWNDADNYKDNWYLNSEMYMTEYFYNYVEDDGLLELGYLITYNGDITYINEWDALEGKLDEIVNSGTNAEYEILPVIHALKPGKTNIVAQYGNVIHKVPVVISEADSNVEAPVDYGTVAIGGDPSILPEGCTVNASMVAEDVLNNIKTSFKAKVGNFTNLSAIEINLFDPQGGELHQLGGKVQVLLPLPSNMKGTSSIVVYRVEENGSYTKLATSVKDGIINFETDHFSTFVIAETSETTEEPPAPTTPTTPTTPQEPNTPTTPTTPNTPQEPNTKAPVETTSGTGNTESIENPETSDLSAINFYLLTMVLSLAAICAIGYKMRRTNK